MSKTSSHSDSSAPATGSLPHGVFDPPIPAQRLIVYIGEGDRWKGAPLYEAIVRTARELHMAGATVVRGPMGFGAASRVHTAKVLRLSEDLPLKVEIVDTRERIAELVPRLREMLKGGLVTIEDVRVVVYSPGA